MFLSGVVTAYRVTEGSPCTALCSQEPGAPASNSSQTAEVRLVCEDGEFGTDAAGKAFESCGECLLNSDFVNGEESDQLWFLCKSDNP